MSFFFQRGHLKTFFRRVSFFFAKDLFFDGFFFRGFLFSFRGLFFFRKKFQTVLCFVCFLKFFAEFFFQKFFSSVFFSVYFS